MGRFFDSLFRSGPLKYIAIVSFIFFHEAMNVTTTRYRHPSAMKFEVEPRLYQVIQGNDPSLQIRNLDSFRIAEIFQRIGVCPVFGGFAAVFVSGSFIVEIVLRIKVDVRAGVAIDNGRTWS